MSNGGGGSGGEAGVDCGDCGGDCGGGRDCNIRVNAIAAKATAEAASPKLPILLVAISLSSRVLRLAEPETTLICHLSAKWPNDMA